MSIQKIKESELRELGVSALPSRPSFPSLYEGRARSAKELREAFDRLPRLIAERFNALLDACGLLDGERESLAEAIATELFEGHSLADLFRDIESGALLSYLKNERGEDLSSLLLALASPKGGVGAGETGAVSGETVEARLLKERGEILRSAASLYRLSHPQEGGASLCLEVFKDGAWQTAGDLFSLPKDIFLKSGTVRTVTEDGVPESGYAVGEKYLDLVLGGETERHIYVKVSDLIDTVSVAHTGTGDIVTSLSSDGNTVTAERGISSSALVKKEELAALDEVYAKREGLASLLRKTALLAHAAEGHAFAYETDASAAFVKSVPAESDAYALLSRIGGKSLGGNLFDEGQIVAHVAGGFSMTYDGKEGCLVLNGTLNETNNFALCNLTAPIAASGKTFSFSYLPVGGSFTTENAAVICCFGSGHDSAGMPMDTYGYTTLSSSKAATVEGDTYQATEQATGVLDSFLLLISASDAEFSAYRVTFNDYRLRIMVNEGEAAKEYAPFRLSHAPATAIKTIGKNICPFKNITETKQSNGITYEALGNGGIHVHGTATALSNRYFTAYYGEPLPIGYKMTRSGVEKGSSVTFAIARMKKDATAPGGWRVDTYMGETFETIEGDYQYRVYLQVDVGKTVDLIVYPQIEVGVNATAFSPYSEAKYLIPAAVQALDGYGRGISDTVYNYLDLENGRFVRRVGERAYVEGDREDESLLTDGVTTLYPLEEAETVDISAYLFDGFLSVEGKGMLFFENEKKWDVPSEVTYQLKLTEGDNA